MRGVLVRGDRFCEGVLVRGDRFCYCFCEGVLVRGDRVHPVELSHINTRLARLRTQDCLPSSRDRGAFQILIPVPLVLGMAHVRTQVLT